MAILKQQNVHNKLLALLPEVDFDLLAPDLQHVVLARGTTIAVRGTAIKSIYFLTSGIGSVIVTTPEGHRAEAGVFGSDGYVPSTAIAGVVASSFDVGIQLDAEAYRMEYGVFRQRMEDNINLNKIMLRSIEAFAVQLAYTAVSNAVHDVNERLARWLLMCHDRTIGNEIPLTHEFISLMLAVRRPSVTTSLHILEGNGFIKATRGNITIWNRPALEEFARDAYGQPEEEYRRLMKDIF